MKLGGEKFVKPNLEIIVIPRGDGEDIVFKAGPVGNMDDFEKLCPLPEPPVKMYPGGRKSQNVKDEGYQKKLAEHAELRFHFMAIQSLKMTEELEWETVDEAEPSTWTNYMDELREAGFSEVEVNRVVQGVMDANCLNEDRIEEARQRFLASQQEALEKSSTLADEPSST
jgi:hypothetical protein